MKINIEVTVDPMWYETAFSSDFFNRNCIGYWAYGVEISKDKSDWLIFEEGQDQKLTNNMKKAALACWRDGLPLPKYFHRLDKKLIDQAYGEGVKRSGVDWFQKADSSDYDMAIQMALFGKLVYG